jgi:hypothetical protein
MTNSSPYGFLITACLTLMAQAALSQLPSYTGGAYGNASGWVNASSGTNMQRPVSEGEVDLTALTKLQVPVALDGEPAGPDDVFRDVRTVCVGAH